MTQIALFLTSIALTISSLQAAKPELIAEPAERPSSVLTIRIYNYAGVDATLVRDAARSARAIYARAGIETDWRLCEIPGVAKGDELCRGPWRPDTLQMRIVESASHERDAVDGLVFGFALPKEGGFGTMASAFWGRIAETAVMSEIGAAQLLGFVMAHEAGHLLLGFNSHSAEGMMSGRWDETHLIKIGQGWLNFVGKQRKRIQSGAAERLLAANR